MNKLLINTTISQNDLTVLLGKCIKVKDYMIPFI